MGRPKKAPRDAPEYISQAECGRRLNIDPAQMTRMKADFARHGLPGFSEAGVIEYQVFESIRKLDALRAGERGGEKANQDADARYKNARAERASIETQALKGETIYVDDVVDLFSEMAMKFRTAQLRVPQVMAPLFLGWLASMLAEEIHENPKLAKALDAIKAADVQRWLDDQLDRSLGDLGVQFEGILGASIKRARLRAS